uniref:Neuronal calcium sensor 2 n=1 Tax=Caligus clemensi TaxID=344056 RepID=C1C0E5_CALCM|nr:Neuronal calcium sensor 2 [Caligus clemensi]
MGNKNGKPFLSEEDLAYITSHTSLDRAQADAYYNNFLTDHPKGKINLKSFKKMIEEAYPDSKNVDKFAKHVFRMYDSNDDGSIDFQEFMLILYVLSSGGPEDNLKQIFKIFDINRNGSINMKEMKKIVKDLSCLSDPKGPKGKKEQEALAKGVFKEMDKDDDGAITEEEFLKAIMSEEKLSMALTLKIVDVFVMDEDN